MFKVGTSKHLQNEKGKTECVVDIRGLLGAVTNVLNDLNVAICSSVDRVAIKVTA